MATRDDAQQQPSRETDGFSHDSPAYEFPTERLRVRQHPDRVPLVLVVCGSFSPITIMHLRLCEMASDWVRQIEEDYEVVGIYLSPVSDAYKKKGLVEARHRIRMCELAVNDSPGIVMVDPWEALSPHYVFTVKVLDHFKHEVNEVLGGVPDEQGVRRKARVALLAGSDLLQTMSAPGVWSTEDLERILDDGGMYVVERAGADVQEAKANMGKWADGISIIPQNIPIDLSSTKVRLFRQKGMSVKYLLPNCVIDYIVDNGLYLPPAQEANQTAQDPERKREEEREKEKGKVTAGPSQSPAG